MLNEKIVVLTIKNASKLSIKQRKKIAQWLKEHSNMLIKEGNNYSNLFRGYYYK